MDKINKNTKPYIYLVLVFFLVLISSSYARFTSSKKHDGNVTIKNHPCDTKKITSMGKEFTVNLCKPDFSKAALTKEGIFMAEDDYGESYYYRGAADNWVYFAGLYWRIVRINGDGSIRLIYDAPKGREGNYVKTEKGMYSYECKDYIIPADPNIDVSTDEKKSRWCLRYQNTSTSKAVNDWYKTNIIDKNYEDKISDSGFCNDMTDTAEERVIVKHEPTLKCPDKTNDFLTKANNKLKYPIGIITFDEVSFSGLTTYWPEYLENKTAYLCSPYNYMTENTVTTMTVINVDARKIGVISAGHLFTDFGPDNGSVARPVINLKPSVTITSGDGTEASPYVIN